VYPFSLSAGHYLYVRVDQPGIDVTATLADPSGKTVVVADDPDGRVFPERIALVAPVTGGYQLTLTPRNPHDPPGIYRIELQELRPGRSDDRKRVAAERELAEGRRQLRLEDQRSLREAAASLAKALGLWRDAGDRGGQVRALNELAQVERMLREGSKAWDRAQEALRMARERRDQVGEATALNLLGSLCSSNESACGTRDPVRRSIELQQQALALWRQLGSPAGEGRSLNSLALIHLGQVNVAQARKELEPARNLLHAAGDTEGEAYALVYLQGVYYDLGDIGKAREYAQQALELSRTDRRQAVEGSALYNLARIDKLRGDLETALKSFEENLAVVRRLGGRESEVARVLQALGSVYFDLGDLDQALSYFQQSLEASVKLKDLELQARLKNHIGLVLYLRGDRQEALRKYGEALALSTTSGFASVTGLVQTNLGTAKVDLGRAEEGLADLQAALKLRRAKGTPGEQAQTLREVGTAFYHLRLPGQAAAAFAEALKIGEQIGSPVLTSECLYRWALLERDQGRLSEALAKIEKTIGIVESVRTRMGTETFRTSFFASKRTYYELYVDLLMRLDSQNGGKQYEAKALEASEQARARGLLELLSRRVDVRQGIAPELKQRETELGERMSWLLDQLRQQNPSQATRSQELRSQLDQTEKQVRNLEAEIRLKYPHYAGVRYPTPLHAQQIEGLLGDQTALLQYFLGKERSFLFVVTRGHLASYELPGADWIADRVRSLRSVLDKPNPLTKARFCQEAAELYGKLMSPAAGILAGKRHLLIAPDGPLYFLPFEALLTETQGLDRPYEKLPYLLLGHTVSYVPSASVLASLRLPKPAPLAKGEVSKMFVGFADPLYGKPADAPTQVAGLRGGQMPALPPLPRSREEVEQVARFYPGNEVLYLGASATKRNVTENSLLKNARRIHFATHGLVNEIRPELSALALTPEGKEDDGLLRVSEIFNLELTSDLVVLSACETGLGKQVIGEGVLGLTRAFLYAGAKSVVVSLWPVLETGTPELMKSFYGHLDASGSKVEALRVAKLDMIRGGQANPSYWAPFVLAGDSK